MKKLVFVLAVFIVFSSCASFKTKINTAALQGSPPTDVAIIHSCFLIGDAGNARLGESTPSLVALQKLSKNANASSNLFFLGDNVYEKGVAEIGHNEEELSRHRLQVQIDLARNFAGQAYFIPGNHDWGFGKPAVLRQQEIIESQISDEAYLPDNGCPGPETLALSDNLLAIVFDSEWYLGDWPNDQSAYSHCTNQTRASVLSEIQLILDHNPNKDVLLVMHHPLFSYGPHAGYYSTKDHLFPLTNVHPAFYLPLPVVGSLAMWIRRAVKRPQDLGHERYDHLKKELLRITRNSKRVIFVSGHEHTQQWIKYNDKHFIVSGAGAKIDPAKLGENSLFASGRPGFAVLDYYENGEVWIRFYSIEKKGAEAKLSLQAPLYGPKS